MARSTKNYAKKLKQLCELEGFEEMEMLELATYDNVAHAICVNPGCECTAMMEPDQDAGWCAECNEGSVASCLVLAGML